LYALPPVSTPARAARLDEIGAIAEVSGLVSAFYR
jgi:hypothetical protein